MQGYSWPCGGELTIATVCSVKKAGGCRKCSRKEHDAFSFWGLKVCGHLVLEAVWIFWDASIQVLLFLLLSVAHLREVFWIRFLPLQNSSYTPYCFFDSDLFIFISLTPLSVPWGRISWGCVCGGGGVCISVICSPLSPITSATWEYKSVSSLVASAFTTGDRKTVFLPVVPVEKGWRPCNLTSLFSKKDVVPVTQRPPFIHCHFSNQGSRGSFPSSKKSKGSHLPCSGSAGMR